MKLKRKRHHPKPDRDAVAMRDALLSIVTGIGNGGLTLVARQLGMTPSSLRKRLVTANIGFDAPTMRAVMMLADMKANGECAPGTGQQAGDYEIFTTPDGHKWRKIE